MFGDKTDYDMIPHKEDFNDFIRQGTSSKEKVTLFKSHNFCEKYNFPDGYFDGKKY